MANTSQKTSERKDCFYLETLAQPGEINSMVVGRFFNKNVESLVLAKSTFLSIFNNNEEEDSFDFVDHICVYKEVYCLCTSVQPHSLDCLFVLSIGGEWLFLQWNKTRFFPLATGSLLKGIQPLMKTPEQRRFRLDPTFQWAVSVVPITDNSPHFFTRPAPQSDVKQVPGSTKPIVRISFRAVIVVDETVFVGVKYDGPDANFLSVIKDNWSFALKQIPSKFGFFDPDNKQGYKQENMNMIIKNGLENEWKVLQTIESNKKNLCIADADTFIFFEDDDDQPQNILQEENKEYSYSNNKKNNVSLFELINRVRHLVFTTSMRLYPFPIKKKPFIMPSFPYPFPLGREIDGEVVGPGLNENEKRGRIQLPEYCSSDKPYQKIKFNVEQEDKLINTNIQSETDSEYNNQSCATALVLVDTPAGISILSLLFNFEHHRIQLHSFIVTAIPPSASRLMTIIDEKRIMKTLKGEDISLVDRLNVGDVDIVKETIVKTNDYLKDYNFQQSQSNEEFSEINNNDYNNKIEEQNTNQISLSNPNGNTLQRSNSQTEIIFQLHKHICRSQIKLNTFIITFPNKNIHKDRKQQISHEEDTNNEDEENQILDLTSDQKQLIDDNNLDQQIFTNSDLNINNQQSDNEPIQNLHPFLIITSYAVGLFTSHLTLLKFWYQIPFTEPPMSCLYIGGQEIAQKQIQDQKQIRKRQQTQKDIQQIDKLFIASGRSLIIIARGQIQYQSYPFKWFNELIGTPMLFIISASNSSMIVDLSTGAFYDFPGRESDQKELGEGGPEDFQLNSMNINSVVPLQKYSFSPHYIQEDRYILGVGNGRTGALHNIGLGHKLQTIMQGQWYVNPPKLFTTKAYSGASTHSLLLIEEEKISSTDNNDQDIKVNSENNQFTHVQQIHKQQLYSTEFKIDQKMQYTYSSSIFELHEDAIEPIDSYNVGIDSKKKTLAFGSVQGAYVQITSFKVRIIPTLRFSANQIDQTKSSSHSQQKSLSPIKSNQTNEQIDSFEGKQNENYLQIKSEFIGFDAKHMLSWKAPQLLSEEICIQRIQNLQQNQSNNQESQQNLNLISNNASEQNNETQRIIFECACITDDLIAVSYKCIVFVLLWNPSKPKIESIPSNQPNINQQQILQLPASIRSVSTLCFPSPVKTLSASTICGRSFLSVGCESPPAVYLFRLDAFQVSLQTEQSRKKLWDDGEKILDNMKYQIVYPSIQRPNPALIIQNGVKNKAEINDVESRHNIRIGSGNECKILSIDSDKGLNRKLKRYSSTLKQLKFIEVLSGSNQFVEVQYSSNITMTRILDLYPYDIPEQILLTTFNRQLLTFTQNEINDNELNRLIDLSIQTQKIKNQQKIEIDQNIQQQNYLNNEGAALLISGHNGQLSTSILPLSSLLEYPPNQSKQDQKLSEAQFFFPSLITNMKICPQPVKLAEDKGIIYLYGDRASALSWSYRAGMIIWTELECPGIIRSLMPMRIKDEEETSQINQDDISSDGSEKVSLPGSQISSKENATNKTPIAHPTLVYIDYVERRLTFGTIDKRNIILRNVKDLPSLPLSIAHIPTIHAIAVLCREHSQYPYYDQAVENNKYFEQNNLSISEDKDEIAQKKPQYYRDQNINYQNSKQLIGLGLDESGIVGVDRQMYMPFHEIFQDYLHQRKKIENINLNQNDNANSPSQILKSPQIGDQQNQENIINKKNDLSKYQLTTQYFQETIPEIDEKGEQFSDIASDWYIECHSKHFKNYLPKKQPPYKCNPPKITLCYSPNTNFSIAFPPWLDTLSILKALKNNNLSLTAMKRKYILNANNGLTLLNEINKGQNTQENDIQINEQLPLPSKDQLNQYNKEIQIQFSSSQSDIQGLKTKQQNIFFTSKSLEQFVQTVTSSYVIILFDEIEMNLRIGELNLSRLNLDFGKSQHELGSFPEQNQLQNKIENNDQLIKQSNSGISTFLYNFFSMACVTIPTQIGYNEINKYQSDSLQRQNMIKTQQKHIQSHKSKESNIKLSVEINIKGNNNNSNNQNIKQIENQQEEDNQQEELDNEDEFMKMKINEVKERIKENKQTSRKSDYLKPMYIGEFNDRYARSLICVLGREGAFGIQRSDISTKEQLESQSQQQRPLDAENETFYENMLTDIFIFEIDRNHILNNERIKARSILQDQLAKSQKNENIKEQTYFQDEIIQQALDECDNVEHSYGDISTAAISTVYDKSQLLNVSLTLQKRIRILGGVQGIYGHPSTLVVLNGRGAFVFVVGARLDDQQLSAFSKVYQITKNSEIIEKNIRNQIENDKNKEIKKDQQLINNKQSSDNINQSEQEQFIYAEYCTCTTPLISRNQTIIPSAPFHASISNVRTLSDNKFSSQFESNLSIPNLQQYYSFNNVTGTIYSRPIETYNKSSPFTIIIRQVALIIAPSSITSFSLYPAYCRPGGSQIPNSVQSMTVFNEQSAVRDLAFIHKMSNIVPSYISQNRYLRAALIFSPCGFAFVDIKFNPALQSNNIAMVKQHKLCAFNQNDAERMGKIISKSKHIYDMKRKKLNNNQNQNKIKKKEVKQNFEYVSNSQISKSSSDISKHIPKLKQIPPSLQVFYKKQDYEKIELPGTSILPLSFIQKRCYHCNQVIKQKQNYSINLLQNISSQSSNSIEQNNSQINQIQSNEQVQSSPIKLPLPSGTDIGIVAGIYLKHRPIDLIKPSIVFGQKISLIAQAYAPSLIIDAAQVGINQFALIGDYDILIYALVPNPLYKRVKHQFKLKNSDQIIDNDGYEYLPMCVVLNARIPTYRHFSFIQRCSLGLNSVFSGLSSSFINKMHRNMEMIRNSQIGNNEPVDDKDNKNINKQGNELNQQTDEQNEADDDSLYAEDFDSKYYMNMVNQNQTERKLLNLSQKGSMQILPAVPSFILFSRSGAIIRSIPSYFDQIPVKELFVNSHIFFILDQCFGDIWKHQQIKLFNEYYRLDEQTLRLSTIERSIREYISTGRISRRPPFPMGEYLPPMYGLKDWRFLESQSIFGLSPFPITPETTSWKILNIQNAIATVKRQILYGRTLNQHRLVIREILRRLLKNFNSLNLPKGNIDEIQDKNTETLLIKLTYILMCTITKPISTIQRNIEEDFAKRMYFLFKQSRIGLRQLSIAINNPNDKFIKRLKQEYQQMNGLDRTLNNQFWLKYRNLVFQEQIGIKQKFSISFKDDETVDGVLPPGLSKDPIKLSKKSQQYSSQYALDLYSITEKLYFNKTHLQTCGMSLQIDSLFKSLVKVNQNVQMISKGKDFYKKVHLDMSDEKSKSDDEIDFISKFTIEALPMYSLQQVNEPKKKQSYKNEKQISHNQQSEKKQQVTSDSQKHIQKDYNVNIQDQINIQSNDSKHHLNQVDNKNIKEKNTSHEHRHDYIKDRVKMKDNQNEREKDRKYQKERKEKNQHQKEILKDLNHNLSQQFISIESNQQNQLIQNRQSPQSKFQQQQQQINNSSNQEQQNYQDYKSELDFTDDFTDITRKAASFHLVKSDQVLLPSLQRVQYNQHFPHYIQSQEEQQDVDYGENAGIVEMKFKVEQRNEKEGKQQINNNTQSSSILSIANIGTVGCATHNQNIEQMQTSHNNSVNAQPISYQNKQSSSSSSNLNIQQEFQITDSPQSEQLHQKSFFGVSGLGTNSSLISHSADIYSCSKKHDIVKHTSNLKDIDDKSQKEIKDDVDKLT